MFEVDQFIDACRAAVSDTNAHAAVREVLARAVSDPTAIIRSLGEPSRAQIERLYQSPQLTILNVVWAPKMTIFPHNHDMWAVIGIYSGREDNVFWRRLPQETQRVEAAGAKAIGEREAVPLGRDIIHSVTNPIERLTGALHVYGGDFFHANRSEWDPESLLERRCDPERLVRIFEEENARLRPLPVRS